MTGGRFQHAGEKIRPDAGFRRGAENGAPVRHEEGGLFSVNCLFGSSRLCGGTQGQQDMGGGDLGQRVDELLPDEDHGGSASAAPESESGFQDGFRVRGGGTVREGEDGFRFRAPFLIVGGGMASDDDQAALRQKLEAMSNKRVSLITRVDAALIGGIRVEMDGKRYDNTIQNKLSRLKQSLVQGL